MKKVKKLLKKCGIGLTYVDYIELGRILSDKKVNLFRRFLLQNRFKRLGVKYGIEIPNFANIGKELVLAHPYAITVNPKCKLGNNIVLFKGCTIGSIRGGIRKGTPVIDDNVVIGTNAMVCGGIHISSNVLIAANSFVDFDVPSNSIVIGNPGKIHYKENPTKDYVESVIRDIE